MTIYDLFFTRTNSKPSIGVRLCFAVAGLLARLNGDDYGFRRDYCMLTREEAKAYLQAEAARKQEHERAGAFWSGIWGG